MGIFDFIGNLSLGNLRVRQPEKIAHPVSRLRELDSRRVPSIKKTYGYGL